MDDSVYHGRCDYPEQYLVTILQEDVRHRRELLAMWDSQRIPPNKAAIAGNCKY